MMFRFIRNYYLFLQIGIILILLFLNSLPSIELIGLVNILATFFTIQFSYNFFTRTLRRKFNFKIKPYFLLMCFVSIPLMLINMHNYWSIEKYLLLFINVYIIAILTVVGLLINYFSYKEP